MQIIPKIIENEMKEAYVNYAMSVIVGRALPDVRDGLKPVHRRILYAMHSMGMLHNKPYKKSARIVGEVLGKYHPHGDSAVYDALVRMAQDFSLYAPLIDGQGNFGSIDGDNAASMRYTEARLTKIAEFLLENIDKDTVNFRENFDGTLNEPEILPTKLPNLLLNGSSGIAVGMATSVPPHNLTELATALKKLIINPELTCEELIEFLPAPDFPTGGQLIVTGDLKKAYLTGHGKCYIKSNATVTDTQIIIHDIPYQVNKTDLIMQIADLCKNKRIEGIRNINDESDREGIRVVIDLKQNIDGHVILNQLYKYSRLKVSFPINFLAINEGKPEVMDIKTLLNSHISHRFEINTRKIKYLLDLAKKRLHILEGLNLALSNIDDVIAGIRKSQDASSAKEFLLNNYDLDETQAKSILDMKLQKLSSLEREKISNEREDLLNQTKDYTNTLNDNVKILKIIEEEFDELISLNVERKSTISYDNDDIDIEDLIAEEQVCITVSSQGYMKRIPIDEYKAQSRGGKGSRTTNLIENDYVENIYVTSTHNYFLCFTNQGNLHWLKVYKIPQNSKQARGRHINSILELKGEEITSIIPVQSLNEGYLVMLTSKGIIKRCNLSDFSNVRRGGIRAITLQEDEMLVNVSYTDGEKQIMLATKKGMANRFNENQIRVMGRTARGVKAINLNENDEIVGMVACDESNIILTVSENGYGKRTSVSEYRLTKRGSKGVTNLKITEKNGEVKAIKLVNEDDDIILISEKGITVRTNIDSIREVGRVSIGVRIINLNEGDKLSAIAIIKAENENES